MTRNDAGPDAVFSVTRVADVRAGRAREVLRDHGDACARGRLRRRVPAPGRDVVLEQRLLGEAREEGVLAFELDAFASVGCATRDPGVVRISRTARASNGVPTTVFKIDVEVRLVPDRVRRRRDAVDQREHRQQRPDREADLDDGRQAAPPRRVTLRMPICAVRGRKPSRRKRAVEQRPGRPRAPEPLRAPRAPGRARRGGSPAAPRAAARPARATMLRDDDRHRRRSKPGEIAKKLEPK